MGRLTVGNDADANGLIVAVPALAGDSRPLSLPILRRLYFTVAAAVAVAQTKVTVQVVGIARGYIFCRVARKMETRRFNWVY